MDINDTVSVCDCCLLMVVNHDDSSCRDYYNHTHQTFNLPGVWAYCDDMKEPPYEWTCDGCDEEQGAYAHLSVLTLIAH